ncbi:MAG: aminotransferase, partial [Nakamurella sp.]
YAPDGTMTYPEHRDRAGESVLAHYLVEARKVLDERRGLASEGEISAEQVSADFEQLRWFELPAQCLV